MNEYEVDQLRDRLTEVFDRVIEGDEFVITRRGQPIAVIVDIESWELMGGELS